MFYKHNIPRSWVIVAEDDDMHVVKDQNNGKSKEFTKISPQLTVFIPTILVLIITWKK